MVYATNITRACEAEKKRPVAELAIARLWGKDGKLGLMILGELKRASGELVAAVRAMSLCGDAAADRSFSEGRGGRQHMHPNPVAYFFL